MNIADIKVKDLTDSDGASTVLSDRFHKDYSVDSVHQLVKKGRLRAWIFQKGVLVERTPETQTRGKDLLFLFSDLQAVPLPRKAGRPKETSARDVITYSRKSKVS